MLAERREESASGRLDEEGERSRCSASEVLLGGES